MDKKVMKLYTTTKDEEIKSTLQPLVDKWLDSDEVDEKTKEKLQEASPKEKEKEEVKEEVKPKEEVPKEEPKKEEEVSKVPQEVLDMFEALNSEIKSLKERNEEYEKNQPFGYQSKSIANEGEMSSDDILTKMKSGRKYT